MYNRTNLPVTGIARARSYTSARLHRRPICAALTVYLSTVPVSMTVLVMVTSALRIGEAIDNKITAGLLFSLTFICTVVYC